MANKIAYDMFKHYNEPDKAIPDNRFGRIISNEPPSIVYGGTNSIVSCVPGIDISDVAAIILFMRSGLDTYTIPLTVADEETGDVSVIDEEQTSITQVGPSLSIEYIMNSEESALMLPKKDFYAQCQVTLINGEIVFTPKVKYKVVDTLLNTWDEDSESSDSEADNTSLIW